MRKVPAQLAVQLTRLSPRLDSAALGELEWLGDRCWARAAAQLSFDARPPPTPLTQLCSPVPAPGGHTVFAPAALDASRVEPSTGGTLLAPAGIPLGHDGPPRDTDLLGADHGDHLVLGVQHVAVRRDLGLGQCLDVPGPGRGGQYGIMRVNRLHVFCVLDLFRRGGRNGEASIQWSRPRG
jgi:hypothetical protein